MGCKWDQLEAIIVLSDMCLCLITAGCSLSCNLMFLLNELYSCEREMKEISLQLFGNVGSVGTYNIC